MTSTAPIGVFDSGLGGISVVRELVKDLPDEQVLYFGDSANAPYGTKTPESAAVDALREQFSIPIIGMEPALKVACDRGHGVPQHVIVAATPLTLRERKFAKLMARFNADNVIYKQPCPALVEIVEHGQLDDRELVERTLHGYFDQYDLETIDSVVLGCTHFPFFREYFRRLMPSSTAIIDGNEGTVRHLRVVLEALGKLAPEGAAGGVSLSNSDTSERMATLMKQLLTR